MAYQWNEGFRAKAVTAEQAHSEMERLREGGPLTAKRVFEASKPAKAKLHGEFEWDGQRAIEELGLDRARKLMRAVVIVHEETPSTPPQHVYVHVPDQQSRHGEGAYVPLTVVAQEIDGYERAYQALQQKFAGAEFALSELRSMIPGSEHEDKLTAITLATDAFATVREVLRILAA